MKRLLSSFILVFLLCLEASTIFAFEPPTQAELDASKGNGGYSVDYNDKAGTKTTTTYGSDNKATSTTTESTKANANAWVGDGVGWNSSTNLRSASFTFDPAPLSPSERPYKKGTGNIQELLNRIASILLVVVSTWAVLFIAVGGFMMAISAGDSDRATKGRTIITYNIQALILAMLAFGIIKFVLWVVWN